MDLLAKAEHELTELSPQIAAMQQRQEALRSFIAIGRSLFGANDVAPQDMPQALGTLVATMPMALLSAGRQPSVKDQILALAQQAIEDAGPQPTRALVDYIEGRGVVIGSADKILAVSAILSRAKGKFKSDRTAGGWTLASDHKEQTPQGASTPAGSDVEFSQPVPEEGQPERQPADMA